MDKRLKCQTQNHKNPRRKHRQQNFGYCSQNFLSDIAPQARKTKARIKKWDYIKLKSFYTAKEIVNKIKRQPTEWENIFANTSNKGLIFKIYKELTKLNTKKTNNPIKKWAKDPN